MTVKTGTFDATKVVLDVLVHGGGPSGNQTVAVELRYWFADAANRYVKYELRANSQNFSQPNMDMELVSYTPAGK